MVPIEGSRALLYDNIGLKDDFDTGKDWADLYVESKELVKKKGKKLEFCSCVYCHITYYPQNLMALNNNHCTIPQDFVGLELKQGSAGYFFCSTWYQQGSLRGLQLAWSCVLVRMAGRLYLAGTVDQGTDIWPPQSLRVIQLLTRRLIAPREVF